MCKTRNLFNADSMKKFEQNVFKKAKRSRIRLSRMDRSPNDTEQESKPQITLERRFDTSEPKLETARRVKPKFWQPTQKSVDVSGRAEQRKSSLPTLKAHIIESLKNPKFKNVETRRLEDFHTDRLKKIDRPR